MGQTDSCQRGVGSGGQMKEEKGLAKALTCTTHGHRQQCGEGQREGEMGAGWRWAKGQEMETFIIVSVIKIKLKIKLN